MLILGYSFAYASYSLFYLRILCTTFMLFMVSPISPGVHSSIGVCCSYLIPLSPYGCWSIWSILILFFLSNWAKICFSKGYFCYCYYWSKMTFAREKSFMFPAICLVASGDWLVLLRGFRLSGAGGGFGSFFNIAPRSVFITYCLSRESWVALTCKVFVNGENYCYSFGY